MEGGRSSERSAPKVGDTTRWNDPSYWQGIVANGDGDELAKEAQEFLGTFETNLPKDMRPGFSALEDVLLDVCKHAPANVIRDSSKAIAATTA